MSNVQAHRGQIRRLPVRRARPEGLGLGAMAVAIPGAIFWLAVSFADGPAYYAMAKFGFTGHLLLILPIILAFMFYTIVVRRMRFNTKALFVQFALLFAFLAYWLVQRLVIGEIREVAYFQTYVMIALLVATTDFFRQNAEKLAEPFGRAVTLVHYILCFYCVASWISLNTGGPNIDWEFVRVTSGATGSRGGDFLRAAGLHREPAWAGIAVSTTFIIAYLHDNRRIVAAYLAFLATAFATASATALLFSALFALYQVVTRRNVRGLAKIAVVVIGLLFVGFVFAERLGAIASGLDPSANMRMSSFRVGLGVIQQTFPLGTGFGNFRQYALYAPDAWANLVDLRRVAFYKTDVAWITIMSELGVFGGVILIWLSRAFFRSRSFLVTAAFIVTTFSIGSLIVPFLIPLAAMAGLKAAEHRRKPPAGAPTAPRPR